MNIYIYDGKYDKRIHRYASIGKLTVLAGVIYGLYKIGEFYEERRYNKIFNKKR